MVESWLRLYMQYTANHEAPEIFHFWNAVGILSAALGRRVWIDRGFYTIYPNPFIVLVAGSALCRKSTSIDISTQFLDKLDCVRIINGKIGSVEKLISKMAWTGPADQLPPTTLIVASELSVFLAKDQTGQKIMDVLTRLFDCPKVFSYESLHGTNVLLKDPCVVVMAATTDSTLGVILPDTSFGGGFASRILFPYGEDTPADRRRLWYTMTDEDRQMRDKLQEKLIRISMRFKGEFTLDQAAIDFSEEWYKKLGKPADTKLDGFVGRKHDHALRTAIVIRAAQEEDQIISVPHFKMAVTAVDEIQAWMPNAFGDVGKGEMKGHQDRVLRHLHMSGILGMSHSDLLRKQYGYLDADQFRKMVGTLIEQRYMVRGHMVGLKSTFYACNCDECDYKRKAANALAKMGESDLEGPEGQGGSSGS